MRKNISLYCVIRKKYIPILCNQPCKFSFISEKKGASGSWKRAGVQAQGAVTLLSMIPCAPPLKLIIIRFVFELATRDKAAHEGLFHKGILLMTAA